MRAAHISCLRFSQLQRLSGCQPIVQQLPSPHFLPRHFLSRTLTCRKASTYNRSNQTKADFRRTDRGTSNGPTGSSKSGRYPKHRPPEQQQSVPWQTVTEPTDKQRRALAKYLDYFSNSRYVRTKCNAMGVPSELFHKGIIDFRDALLRNEVDGLSTGDAVAHIQANSKMDQVLLPPFYRFLASRYPEETEMLSSLISFSDLTSPADWYMEARRTQRKIILHIGPTNSGKTYAALQRFEQCSSGIYCGPLRLLAHEVYERLNAKGVPCNLMTGEERRESDGVFKWAATVEMAPLNRKFDVAVLDEIQMIGDNDRGWAWTQAVLGLQADEIHLCGEPTIIPLIMAMTQDTGDIVEVNRYERLTGLTVRANGLEGNLRNLQKGDCVVTFSRQNIFALKRNIEEKTKMRAAVIYGSLPPETRSEQAKLFNDPNSEFDVLVASDAIGMGLNLNIGRMIFERMEKWDGQRTRVLSISQTKQIAGRAGRYGTQYQNGEVCTLDNYDMDNLKRAMRAPAPNVLTAGLHPTLEQIESFAKYLPNEPLSALLDRFEDLANLGGRYFLCNLDAQRNIAKLIEPVPLTLRDRYTFILSPCNASDPIIANQMLKFAKAQSGGVECLLEDSVQLMKEPPQNIDQLKDMEAQHRLIILYMWLSQRFPETFTDTDFAHFLKRQCESLINRGLASLKFERKRKLKGAAKQAQRLEQEQKELNWSGETDPENGTQSSTLGKSEQGVSNTPLRQQDILEMLKEVAGAEHRIEDGDKESRFGRGTLIHGFERY